jgi:hypothetical protein
VLLVWASAVQPALAQSAEAGKAATRTAMLEADDPRLHIEAVERHDRRGQRHVVDLLGAMRRGRPGG